MKKILSLLLAVAMLFSLIVTGTKVFAQTQPYLEVSSVEGECGEQITIEVSIVNSPGFGGMAYDIKYDNSALKLLSYSIGLGKAICTDSGVDTYKDKVNFQYAGTSNVEGDGVLVTLTFEILQNNSGSTEIVVAPEEGTTFYYDNRTEIDFSLQNSTGIVTVKTKPVVAIGVTLNKDTLSLTEGENETLIATVTPDSATNKAVTWKSSDTTVATVDSNGKVTAMKKGKATITVTTEDGGFIDTCEVSVACSHANTTVHPAVESTCLIRGNNTYAICDDCGIVVSGSDEKLPFASHKGGTATCKDKAVCEVCDKAYGELAPHNMIEKVDATYLKSEANCVAKAVYYKSCSVCGTASAETFETGGLDSTKHIGETEVKNAEKETCTVDGYSGDVYCKDCGVKLDDGKTVPAGHKTSKVDAVPATYEKDGNIEYFICSDCGKLFSDKEATTEITVADTVINKTESDKQENEKAESPHTSDTNAYGIWVAILFAGGSVLVGLAFTRKRKRS